MESNGLCGLSTVANVQRAISRMITIAGFECQKYLFNSCYPIGSSIVEKVYTRISGKKERLMTNESSHKNDS